MVIVVTLSRRIAGPIAEICAVMLGHWVKKVRKTIARKIAVASLPMIFATSGFSQPASLRNKPATTGTIVIRKRPPIAWPTGKSIVAAWPRKCWSEKPTMIGTVTNDSRLVHAVSVIDRHVSPRDSSVIIAAVTPPGQAARIISPTAVCGARSNNAASPNAVSGNSSVCAISPSPTANG